MQTFFSNKSIDRSLSLSFKHDVAIVLDVVFSSPPLIKSLFRIIRKYRSLNVRRNFSLLCVDVYQTRVLHRIFYAHAFFFLFAAFARPRIRFPPPFVCFLDASVGSWTIAGLFYLPGEGKWSFYSCLTYISQRARSHKGRRAIIFAWRSRWRDSLTTVRRWDGGTVFFFLREKQSRLLGDSK